MKAYRSWYQYTPKIIEFEVAVKAALLNWTSGVAINIVRYGVCNGFDAWRKLYNKYVPSPPLAEDLQNILIQELMALKLVAENELDTLFNGIERITDLHAQTGTTENLSEQWVKAAILKISPIKIAKYLAIDLRKAISSDEMQHIINVYMHDHRIGFSGGMLGPMVCAVPGPIETEQEEEAKPNETHPTPETNTETNT